MIDLIALENKLQCGAQPEIVRCVPRFYSDIDTETKENTMNGKTKITDKIRDPREKNKVTPSQEEQINEMLRERDSRYGIYNESAETAQGIIEVLMQSDRYEKLPAHVKHTLTLFATKISRIVNGDPNYDDNWVDIMGYAKLSLDLARQYKKAVDDF